MGLQGEMAFDYSVLSDNEIIDRIKQRDDGAMDYMMKKYGTIVKKEIRTMYLIGAETEDLMQEGMIGLFKAIRDFEPDKGAAFSTFATLCVKRQIQTAINTSNRKKHSPLNSYVSIYAENDENGSVLAEDLEAEDGTSNPEKLILAREQKSAMDDRIRSELSPMEKKVLTLYLEGLAYSDIAGRLERTEKAVDNALQRIRGKLSR